MPVNSVEGSTIDWSMPPRSGKKKVEQKPAWDERHFLAQELSNAKKIPKRVPKHKLVQKNGGDGFEAEDPERQLDRIE